MAKGSTIDQYLSSKGSPLAGLGHVFEQAARRNGFDPKLLVAIAGAESSFGKYGPTAHIFNPFGWGPGRQFGSWEESINSVSDGLGKGYISQGLKTVESISGKWAPVGADNDPHNLNRNWVTNVSKFYGEMRGVKPGLALAPRVTPEFTSTQPGSRDYTTPSAGDGVQSLLLRDLGILASGGTPDFQASLGELLSSYKHDLGSVGDVQFGSDIEPGLIQDEAGIVAEAKKYLGTPYVFGTAGPKNFDCSGFAKYLYKQVYDLDLPHYAASQFKMGRPVDRDALQAGDLVFFHMKKDGPGHEGMYIGGGQFIHAPKTGDVVKISSLDDEWYRRNWVGARRIRPSDPRKGR